MDDRCAERRAVGRGEHEPRKRRAEPPQSAAAGSASKIRTSTSSPNTLADEASERCRTAAIRPISDEPQCRSRQSSPGANAVVLVLSTRAHHMRPHSSGSSTELSSVPTAGWSPSIMRPTLSPANAASSGGSPKRSMRSIMQRSVCDPSINGCPGRAVPVSTRASTRRFGPTPSSPSTEIRRGDARRLGALRRFRAPSSDGPPYQVACSTDRGPWTLTPATALRGTAPAICTPQLAANRATSSATARNGASSHATRSIFVTAHTQVLMPSSSSTCRCPSVCGTTCSVQSTTTTPTWASDAPVAMFLRSSAWPGTSISTYLRRSVSSTACAVSSVKSRSRSSVRPSRRKASPPSLIGVVRRSGVAAPVS